MINSGTASKTARDQQVQCFVLIARAHIWNHMAPDNLIFLLCKTVIRTKPYFTCSITDELEV